MQPPTTIHNHPRPPEKSGIIIALGRFANRQVMMIALPQLSHENA